MLNDKNLPQMEKFLTVLILANDIVDTLTIIRIAIERTLWYFLKKICKGFFFYLNSFRFIFWNCSLPKFFNILNGVLYTSSIAPLIIFGAMRSTSAPPDLIIWSILSCVILFISPVACVIILGSILPTWFTVSLPAYAKSYRFKNPPTCFFLVFFEKKLCTFLTSFWVNNYLDIFFFSASRWIFFDIEYINIFVWFKQQIPN